MNNNRRRERCGSPQSCTYAPMHMGREEQNEKDNHQMFAQETLGAVHRMKLVPCLLGPFAERASSAAHFEVSFEPALEK